MAKTRSTTDPAQKDLASTPPAFVRALEVREDITFDLDPFTSGAFNAKAPQFYTEAEDGFVQPWQVTKHPSVVFGNPPYSGNNIAKACTKAYNERTSIAVAYLLLPSNTESAWFHAFAPLASRVIFIRGRIQFKGPWERSNNDTGSLILVFHRYYEPVRMDFWSPSVVERGGRGRRVQQIAEVLV